jgi:hypothetical protein
MTTPNFQLPTPSRAAVPPENVDEAFDLIIAALEKLDGILKTQADGISDKAPKDHKHPISGVDGLSDALAKKMSADRIFKVADLSDIEGADAAPEGYVIVKKPGGTGWMVMSAAAAIGQHKHQTGDVVGLDDAFVSISRSLSDMGQSIGALGDGLLERLKVTGAQSLTAAQRAVALGNLGLDEWALWPIGVPIPIFDHMVGVVAPPKNNASYRYVLLTAAQTGVGAYNAGILTGETITGSAPLVDATAVINLAGSPINGQTIRLINTERRFLRAGNAGTVETDALQNITGGIAGANYQITGVGSGAFTTLVPTTQTAYPQYNGSGSSGFSFDASRVARTATETRSKNLGVTYYMRIK